MNYYNKKEKEILIPAIRQLRGQYAAHIELFGNTRGSSFEIRYRLGAADCSCPLCEASEKINRGYTTSLNPCHYCPWVVMDGKPCASLGYDYETDLLSERIKRLDRWLKKLEEDNV